MKRLFVAFFVLMSASLTSNCMLTSKEFYLDAFGGRVGRKAAKKIVDSMPQFQSEETKLRRQCNKLAVSLLNIYGPQVRTNGTIKSRQIEYLKKIGTPVALRLLAELQKTVSGF